MAYRIHAQDPGTPMLGLGLQCVGTLPVGGRVFSG